MKTVCIDVFSALPVPAIKGGAVETLYSILLEENEKYNKLNLIIISPFDKDAEKESKKYKNSRIIYVKKNDIHKRIYNKIIHFVNKISKKQKLYEYDNAIENRYIKSVKADYYVTAGNGSHYKPLAEKFGMDKVIFHIHTEVKATEESDAIFKRTIGVSRYVSETYYKTSKWDASNGKVVLNCTDEEKFKNNLNINEKNEIREKIGFKADDFVIIFTGRIIKDKGLDLLISAIEKIDNKKIKLMICGGVNSAQSVKDAYLDDIILRVKSLEDRVKFTGYINHNELYKYYGVSDVQVVPSICEEAAGLVLIEGMYCGLPIIMTDSGGMNEYVNEKGSIVVNRDEHLVDSLIEKILLLYEKEELRKEMSKSNKEHAKLFTKTQFYNDFVECIENW